MPLSILHPVLFALGLLCVSIPIILHLLRRRRRVIPWGAMRFLEEAYRKRRRLITIEQLILLSLRCLLLLLIALGVGALVVGGRGRDDLPTTLVIVLDNSIGAGLVLDARTDLDRNKLRALQAVDTLDPTRGDRVALITASRPSRARVLPASNDIAAVRSLIEQVDQSDARLDLDEAIKLAATPDDDPDRPARHELLIAGQGRGAQSIEQSQDQPMPASFDAIDVMVPATETAENFGILDAHPSRSLLLAQGDPLPLTLRVRLIRSGQSDQEHRRVLRVLNSADAEIAQQTIQWERGQRERVVTLAVDTTRLDQRAGGVAVLRVEIDNDANPSDNTLLVAVPRRERVRVAVIDVPSSSNPSSSNAEHQRAQIAPSRWVRAALAPDDEGGVSIVNINANRASSQLIDGLDAIVVLAPSALDEDSWDRLDRLHQQGVMILLTPDAQGSSIAWLEQVNRIEPGFIKPGVHNQTHETPLSVEPTLTDDNPLAGIGSELPALARAVEIHRSLRIETGAQSLLGLSDGHHMGVWSLPRDGASRGMIVVLAVAFDLQWTDLPARPLFVAMMQELIRQGIGLGVSPEPRLAGDELDESVSGGSSKRISVLPQQPDPIGARVDRLTDRAGLIGHDDRDGALRSITPIWPDATGANADRNQQEAYKAYLATLVDADRINWIGNEPSEDPSAGSGSAEQGHEGRRLGIWMLFLALCVAMIELILARLFTARLIRSDLVAAPIGGRG